MSLIDRSPRTIGGHLKVGALAFGCWRFVGMDVTEARALIETAVDVGMNLIDTADVYGLDWGGAGFGDAERLLGAVLASAPDLRDQVVIATKGGIRPPVPYDSSRDYLVSACDASLARLGVETIDLYQIHRPDLYTHPADVAETLELLRDAGKIRHVGVSNHRPSQVAALQAHLSFRLVTQQPQFSALHLDPLWDGTMDQCMELGLLPLAWSPLAGGRLAAADADIPEQLAATLDRLAEREGVDRAAIALGFVLAHPANPVAIVGTQRPERLREATRALKIELDRKDVYDIIQASQGVPLP